MAFLTDQTPASGVPINSWIHIVDPSDITQNPAGSSFKATIQQVISGHTGSTIYEVGVGNDSVQRIGTLLNSFGNCSVISGGYNNTAITDYSSIVGGRGNYIDQITSSTNVFANIISGGDNNRITPTTSTSDVYGNTIAGGTCNTITPILSGGQTISGGFCNNSNTDFTVISGGYNNTALGRNSTIGGGSFNTADGTRSVITGGGGSCPSLGNKIYCNYGFIGGGIQNTVNGTFSSIIGGGSISLGQGNLINSCYSTIINGQRNQINHEYSTIAGYNIVSKSACTLHTNYLLLYNTPVQDQSATDYLVRDSGSGMVKYKTIPGPTSYGLFTQTGDSSTVSGTIVETTIIGPGIGTLSVPANGFSVGDSFRVIIGGHASFKNNDTITVRVKANSVVLGSTGAIILGNTSNQHWRFNVDFTIRSLGGPGAASITSLGDFSYIKTSSITYEGSNFSTVESTLFDTTVTNTLNITVEFNSTSLSNSMYSELFTLTKTY